MRELDGLVSRAVLCVDRRGFIRAAALPAKAPVSCDTLEGQSLRDVLHSGDHDARRCLVRLRNTGRAHLSIELPAGEGKIVLDAEAIAIDRSPSGNPAAGPWEWAPGFVDAVPVALLGIDNEGRVRLANTACLELLGHSGGELLGRRLAALMGDRTRARAFRAALASGAPEPMRTELRRGPGGESRAVDLVFRRFEGRDGEGPGWVVKLSEVTEDPDDFIRRRDPLDTELRILSHDLRGPLGSLRAFALLLERDFAARLGELGRSYIARLRSNGGRIQSVLDDLLERSRIAPTEESQQVLAPHKILQQLASELKSDLERRHIRLLLPDDPVPVYANPTRFRQVVLNLVLNGIHHMGDVEAPEIQIQVNPAPGGSVLEVRDNGIGIAPDQQPGILELFTCAAQGRSYRGSGLGLSIVTRIVTAHGGQMQVDSRPQEGASFRAFFPERSS